ncbi:hypothetical protein PoB_001266300 [Plakobranchus ocellatus]|uniref:Uncharacterized protein n=1 Tax=Plakobranchus ocellatus TaxID=259542 RepID=A0AAV3YUZ1_9GAST|nr:hypothetical protein PoB_001266300 [Plakobranchus ocellatus]
MAKCWDGHSKVTDLVWVIAETNRTVAIKPDHPTLVPRKDKFRVRMSNWTDNETIYIEMLVSEGLKGIRLACMSQSDVGQPCNMSGVACKWSRPFKVQYGPQQPFYFEVRSDKPLGKLQVGSSMTGQCVACVGTGGHIMWSVEARGLAYKLFPHSSIVRSIREVGSDSALISAGILQSRVRAPIPTPWPVGEPESLRSPCCGLAIHTHTYTRISIPSDLTMSSCGPVANSTISIKVVMSLTDTTLVCHSFDIFDPSYAFWRDLTMANKTNAIKVSRDTSPDLQIVWYGVAILMLGMLVMLAVKSTERRTNDNLASLPGEGYREDLWSVEPDFCEEMRRSQSVQWHGIINSKL